MTQAAREPALGAIVSDLHRQGRLRVWSIVVSALGDLAPQRDAALPAGAMQEIMDVLGIEPGAVRTAVSRLGKDGLIRSARDGRRTSYLVAPSAREEFDAATTLIHAAERPVPGTTPLVLIGPEVNEHTAPPHAMLLRRDVLLWAGTDGPPPEITATSLILREFDQEVPGWVSAAIAPPALREGLLAVETLFAPLVETDGLVPVQAAAARVLLIHYWRRVLLRHPPLASALLPPGWPEPQVRRFVHALYRELTTKARPWLEARLPSPENVT